VELKTDWTETFAIFSFIFAENKPRRGVHDDCSESELEVVVVLVVDSYCMPHFFQLRKNLDPVDGSPVARY
jgi:hypothetical protein